MPETNSGFHTYQLSKILRLLFALPLIVVGRNCILNWYLYQHPSNLILSIALLIAAILIVCSTFISKSWLSINQSILLALVISILALPWIEWLGYASAQLLPNWSRMLFDQLLFFTSVLLVLNLLPKLAGSLKNQIENAIQWMSTLRIERWIVLIFAGMSAGIAIFIYRMLPVLPETHAQFFQAKIFSDLSLAAPVPPVPEFFQNDSAGLIITQTGWLYRTLPGLPLLLSVFMQINLEAFAGALLITLSLVLWIQTVKITAAPGTLQVFAILWCLSPLMLILSAGAHIHGAELFFSTAIFYLCLKQIYAKEFNSLVVALTLCGAVITCGIPVLLFTLPMLLYTCANSKQFALLLVAGVVLGLTILAIYQNAIEEVWTLPASLLHSPSVQAQSGADFSETLRIILTNFSGTLLLSNFWLTGWYSGALLFVLLFLIFTPRLEKFELLWIGGIFLLIFYYAIWISQDFSAAPGILLCVAPVFLHIIARCIEIKNLQEWLLPLIAINVFAAPVLLLPELIQHHNPSFRQSGMLSTELAGLKGKHALVFFDPYLPREFIFWNDPYLQNSPIIVPDLRDKNAALIKNFPDHENIFFRSATDYNINALEGRGDFRFFKQPRENKTFSFFQLAMTLESGGNYPSVDAFDLCYLTIFSGINAREQITILEDKIQRSPEGLQYKDSFKLGIMHTAKMMLMPKKAFDDKGENWRKALDFGNFRTEFQRASTLLKSSAEPGKVLSQQLDKIETRIDRDKDGTLSDEETEEFLERKIKLLKIQK